MVLVAINADDFGLSDGVCRAILELLESRAVSNTTLMAVAPGAQERLCRWRIGDLRGVAGLHLQLSGGSPLSSSSDAPSLVDSRGHFVPRSELANVYPEDVDCEWRRQLDVAAELLGGLPSHLDSHHGVHHLPNCVDIFLSLAVEYGIPVRGGSGEMGQRMAASNVRGSNEVIYDWTARSLGSDVLKEMLLNAARGMLHDQIIEVVTHPGYSDEYLESVSSLNKRRDDDRIALEELASEGWLSMNRFTLTSFPELDYDDKPVS